MSNNLLTKDRLWKNNTLEVRSVLSNQVPTYSLGLSSTRLVSERDPKTYSVIWKTKKEREKLLSFIRLNTTVKGSVIFHGKGTERTIYKNFTFCVNV